MQAIIIYQYMLSNEWAEKNPILECGELGIESDTNLSKLGDGETRWNALSYCGGEENNWQYFSASMTQVPDVSLTGNLRGKLVFVYTGPHGNRTDRACMYLNKTINGQTTCELTPISFFASEEIRKQAEI